MASSVYSLFQRCRYSVRKRMLRYTKLHGNSFYVRQKCRQFLIPLKNPNSINPLKWFCPKSFVCFYVLSYRLFDIFFVHVYVCDAKTCTNWKSAKWYVLSFYMSHFHSIPFYSILLYIIPNDLMVPLPSQANFSNKKPQWAPPYQIHKLIS